LRACDIGYSDCWPEAGFPAKVFEYMALGLPVVTVSRPQATEVLTDGENALFYRSADELAERLHRLAADEELRARLGNAARAALLERHTLEQRQREFGAIVDGRLQPPRTAFPRGEPALVSVVMPVRNEQATIGEQLAALAAQTYKGPWELVLVDDGCTDESISIAEGWRSRLPSLRVVRTSRRGLNRARNTGAAAARGDLLAFCDADDVVEAGWLEALAAAAPHADLVGGTLDFEALNGPEILAWRPTGRLTDLPVGHGFLAYAPGGNCAVWADVARELRWNETYRFGCSDAEFSWRAQLAGYRLAYAPAAVCRQRFRSGLGEMLRQHARYNTAPAHLYRDFRCYGLRSPGLSGGLASWTALLWNSPDLLRSRERRGHWLRLASVAVGRLAGSIRWRAFFP
jgi:GT2 family glycosyltransferase